MFSLSSGFRLTTIALFVFGVLGNSAPLAHGQVSRVPATRLVGQVIAINGPANDPISFQLLLKKGTVDMRVAQNATFNARSAEAQVAGFQVEDYVVVQARKVRRVWVASRIDFDTQPIIPGQVVLSGVIAKVSLNGKHFEIRSDVGELHWVTVLPKTKFRQNGQPLDPAPLLTKGLSVQVAARHTVHGLVAVEIALKISTRPRP